MTRKDYEAIALVIGAALNDSEMKIERDVLHDLERDLVHTFKELNPRFDAERFLTYVLEVEEGTRNSITGLRKVG